MTNHQAHTRLCGLITALNLLLANKEFNPSTSRCQELVSDIAKLQSFLYGLPVTVLELQLFSMAVVNGIIDNDVIVDSTKRHIKAKERYEQTKVKNFAASSRLDYKASN